MNVDIKKSNVELECNWCHKPIPSHTYRLMWTRKNKAGFTNRYYYHCEPDCWMEERVYYADQRYERAAPSGRPKEHLSKEDRRERELARKRDWWNKNRGKG